MLGPSLVLGAWNLELSLGALPEPRDDNALGRATFSHFPCAISSKPVSNKARRDRSSGRSTKRLSQRLNRRRRVPARHEARAGRSIRRRHLGGDLLLRSAAGRGAALLGEIFRVTRRERRTFSSQLSP